MRLSDLPNGKPPVTVPGLNREGLYQMFSAEGFTKGAEIGVEFGENASLMFHTIPGLEMILVDPWADYPLSSYNYGQSLSEQMEGRTRRRLRRREVTYHKMLSEQAAPLVPDLSLDFVYIDGDHNYDMCMLDVILWQRKVRIGGVVSGHDYFENTRRRRVVQCKAVIDDYTRAHGIDRWWITDSDGAERGSKYSSWFWIKEK